FTIDDIDSSDLRDDQPQAGFEVQNTFAFAQLSVSKTVDSAAVDQDGTDISYGPFPTTVECEFNGNTVYATDYSDAIRMQRDLSDGDTWLLEGLPAGAVCTVTETDTKDAVGPSIVTASGPSAPVTTNAATAGISLAALPATNSAALTNPYDTGRLRLSKALTGAGADAWGTEPFTVRVDCTLTDGTGARTVWLKDYTFRVIAGTILPAAVTIDDLAAGASCAITETATGGANSTTVTIDSTQTPGTSATAIITADTLSTALVTNTFQLTEVDVSKVRDGLGADLYGDGPFQVSLQCQRDVDGTMLPIPIPGGATRDLTADSVPVAYMAHYTGLPVGAECELIETLDGGADASVVNPGTFTLEATATDVTVTNTFGDPTVIVRKSFDGDGVPIYGAGPFEVTLECTREVNGAMVPVTIPGGPTRVLDADNGYEESFEMLPSFADCTLTETKTGGATSSSITNPVFTLGDTESVHEVDLKNVFLLAELAVTKQVVGTAAADHSAQRFTIELACVLDVDGVPTDVDVPGGAVRTIAAGETIKYKDLPANADCTITETDNGGANALILQYDSVPVIGSTIVLKSGASTLAMTNLFTLALTGFDGLSLVIYGSVLLFGGTLFVVIGSRRRRIAVD
ncbi:MAG: DUF5979 domain-containing protein, partial [Rhodoglobus sp.]|nr:DUF5979 domain-containing protein [Rhodoglobus sp.]